MKSTSPLTSSSHLGSPRKGYVSPELSIESLFVRQDVRPETETEPHGLSSSLRNPTTSIMAQRSSSEQRQSSGRSAEASGPYAVYRRLVTENIMNNQSKSVEPSP